MKKFFAGLLATAMVACPVTAFAEGTPAPVGSEVQIVGGVEFQGQAMEATIDAKTDADGDGSLAFNMAIPAGEQSINLDLGEVVRYVDDKLYVNAKGISDFYQMLSGDTTVADVLGQIGVDGWVAIEPIPIVFNQESVNSIMQFMSWQPSEQLQASIAAIAEPINVVETEESITITVNNETLIGIADKIDALLADNSEELAGLASLLDIKTLLNIVDYRATFGEYVQAYAEGRASVTGEDAATITNDMFMMVDMLINQAANIIPVPTFDLTQIPDLSDTLGQALGEVKFDGTIVIAEDMSSFDIDANVVQGEETINFKLTSKATAEGVVSDCKITQNGQELAASNFTFTTTETGFNGLMTVSQAGQEVFRAELNGTAAENGYVITGTATQNGQELGSFELSIMPNGNGAICELKLLQAGQEIAKITGEFNMSENLFKAYLSVYQGEQELGSLSVYAEKTETGFAGNLAVTSAGQTVLEIAASGELTETALTGNLTITAQGQSLVCSFEAHPTETGAVEGTFSAKLGEQELISGTFSAAQTEEGFVIDINATAQGQTLHIVAKVVENGVECTIETLAEGEVTMSVKGYLYVNVYEGEAGLDITAPENCIDLKGLIRNVSAWYYQMQQAEAEAETAEVETEAPAAE